MRITEGAQGYTECSLSIEKRCMWFSKSRLEPASRQRQFKIKQVHEGLFVNRGKFKRTAFVKGL